MKTQEDDMTFSEWQIGPLAEPGFNTLTSIQLTLFSWMALPATHMPHVYDLICSEIFLARTSSRICYFTNFVYFVWVCEHAWVMACKWRGQRTACGSWFFPSSSRVTESNSDCQTWQWAAYPQAYCIHYFNQCCRTAHPGLWASTCKCVLHARVYF